MEAQKFSKVAIVSEQTIFLRGLRSLVMAHAGLQIVGEAGSQAEALQLCQMSAPDMVLLDLNRSPETWQETVRTICQNWPRIQVIILLEDTDQAWVEQKCPGMPLYQISRNVSEDEFQAALTQIQQDRQHHLAARGKGRFDHSTAEDQEEPLDQTQQLGQPSTSARNEGLLARELTMAGKIQADILPEDPPPIRGWDIAARLVPAHETSGDFYDFIPLSEHKLGMVVADVTDKGMGAALFMALSSTLIRTYAVRYPTLPAIALSAVSDRILSDTRGGMFVTAFYGILEPHTGRMVYANAGHPPGVLISTRRGKESIDLLRPTGMAMGVSDDARWRQKEARMNPGDVLVLYTDGITEANNPNGVFFEEDRLIETILENAKGSAQQILDALVEAVHRFIGPVPRQDDIAMIVVRREE
jgi:serine phosphatase RsbU (regulator of sigma subunit)